MKYRCGKPVSPLVKQSIRYVSKVGVMSRKTWNEFFSSGTPRWRRKQLMHLIRAKVFRRHPTEPLGGAVVMDSYGVKLVQDMKWQHVYTVATHLIEHDENVARSLIKLETTDIFGKWMSDKELKMNQMNSYKLEMNDKITKYPDAVFQLKGQKSSKVVALEYERTAKSSSRYNKMIYAYSRTNRYDFILFVVETSAIEASIKRAMKYVGDGFLNSQIGFMNVDDWKNDPTNGEIRGLSLGGSLADIAKNC